ncbi:helix-turn-helix transcriptional regulator [Massilia sp. SYSU DXS3249]
MAAKVIQDHQPEASGHGSKNDRIPTALKHFDELPDSAHVRQPVVEGLYGCSAATVWRRVKAGDIPAPSRFAGRVTAWNVGELRRALKIVNV